MTPLKKFICFAAVFIVLALTAHHLLIAGLRRYQGGGSFDVWNQIVGGKVNADILISGSSRALINFDCRAIRDVTGHECFNIGLDGSKINLDIARFKTFLKHNRQPQVLVQVAGIGDLEYGGFLRLHQYAPYLNEDEIYKSLVNHLPEMRYHKYIPLFSLAVYNKELTWRAVRGLLGIGEPENQWPSKPRVYGFLPVDIQWTDEYDRFKREFPDGDTFNISSEAIKTYEELIRLCKERGIELIIVFPPAYYESIYKYTKNVRDIFQVYQQLSARNHVQFWDYSRIPMTRDKENFYNSQHMNSNGAAKFSRLFANDLKVKDPRLSSL
jgi:hypothetical protein